MNEVMKQNQPMDLGKAMESVLIDGDLSKLTSEQRVIYYKKTCESLGINYLTKPFSYIRLNGKLTLYALKDCAEQLRKRDDVSIVDIKTQLIEGVFIVTAYAKAASGKKDVATGAVCINGLKGEALANAYLKAETKAKRRVTLSICGLGFTDESEVDSIKDAVKVNVDMETGEIDFSSLPANPPGVALLKNEVSELAIPRPELVNMVAQAKTIDELKNAYSKAYTIHAGRLEDMKDITELKDMRKKQLEDYSKAMAEGTFDDPVPNLCESVIGEAV